MNNESMLVLVVLAVVGAALGCTARAVVVGPLERTTVLVFGRPPASAEPEGPQVHGRTALDALFVVDAVAAAASFSWITDSNNRPPPTTGDFAYYPPHGNWFPANTPPPTFPAVGGTYVCPVFGTTIKRVENRLPCAGPTGSSDIYSKAGFWSSDAKYFITDGPAPTGDCDITKHRIYDADNGDVFKTSPVTAGSQEPSFSPTDPDILYYFSGVNLRQFNIQTDSNTVVKAFSGSLASLGGSVDYISNNARYFVLNIGGTPSSPQVRVWDRQTDTLYTGTITRNYSGQWVGISPDAAYVILYDNTGDGWSYAINHGTQTVDTTGFKFAENTENDFVNSHSSVILATDGNTYIVGENPNPAGGARIARIRVDTGAYTSLLNFGNFSFTIHASAAKTGRQNWSLVSTSANSGDALNDPNPTGNWQPFRNEVFLIDALNSTEASPVVRRAGHHRTRTQEGGYVTTPRASLSWDGTRVMYASNYGHRPGTTAYADIYFVELPAP